MKRFLSAFAAWLVVLLVAGFFLLGWIFERGYWYRPAAVLALLLAGITCALIKLSDELEDLRKRLDEIEKGRAAPAREKPDQEG